jgi:glycosyltransferase involved in cell wall biosynthesis
MHIILNDGGFVRFEEGKVRGYGGIERVESLLITELLSAGHEVTILASGDSTFPKGVRHLPVVPTHLFSHEDAGNPRAWVHMMYQTADRAVGIIDDLIACGQAGPDAIVHNHAGPAFVRLAEERGLTKRIPVVTTVHNDPEDAGERIIYYAYPQHPYIAISNAQRSRLLGVNWVSTVYNAVPVQSFYVGNGERDILAYLGRFSPVKGAHRAIEIAKQVGMPLMLMGNIDREHPDYFAERVEPHVDGTFIQLIKDVDHDTKNEYLARAKALLFPISWPEPFGLVTIEANACGTPVIGFAYGSVPELITNGENGFLAENVEQAVEAAHRLDELEGAVCRAHAERFSPAAMVKAHLRAYRKVQRQHSLATPVTVARVARRPAK